eukprot:15395804-Alexandrium_andersonii.AAC.1
MSRLGLRRLETERQTGQPPPHTQPPTPFSLKSAATPEDLSKDVRSVLRQSTGGQKTARQG